MSSISYTREKYSIVPFCSRAGAKRRARVLIPLGDLLHPGILTNIKKSKVARTLCHGRWTFNGDGCYAHA